MSYDAFRGNRRPSLGVELELQLVDAETMALRAAIEDVLNGVPEPMRRFFRACLLEGAVMRPGDAWALKDEFDGMLCRLYGPPTFHPLTMS